MLLAYHTLSLVQAVAVSTQALAGISSVVGPFVTGAHALALVYDAGTQSVAGVGLLLLASILLPLSMMLAPMLLQVLAYCYLHPYSCPFL